MQLIALIIYGGFLLIYIFLLFSINSQVKKYLLPEDSAGSILKIFLGGALMLILISFALFMLIPWQEFNSFNFLNLFTFNYEIPLRHKFLKPAYRAGRHGYFSAEKFLRVAPSRSQWFQ